MSSKHTLRPSEDSRQAVDRLTGPTVSRDSDKERRLKEWREKHGIETDHNRKEHKRGAWAAARYGGVVTERFSYNGVSAKRMDQHLDELIAAPGNCIFIPSVRRFAVGVAFITAVERFDKAGKWIVSHVEAESLILLAEPSPQREVLLWDLAKNALADWLSTKTKDRGVDYRHGTPEWQATLDFIAGRPDAKGDILPRILEARGYRTLTGKTRWTRQQVLLARREIEAGKASAALHSPTSNPQPRRYS